MREEIVSLETAVIAKQQRFNYKTVKYFYDEFTKVKLLEDKPTDYSKHKRGLNYECIGAPSQPLLQRWLREVHDLHICINYFIGGGTGFSHVYSVEVYNLEGTIASGDYVYDTYEEALEKALQKALGLVEKK